MSLNVPHGRNFDYLQLITALTALGANSLFTCGYIKDRAANFALVLGYNATSVKY